MIRNWVTPMSSKRQIDNWKLCLAIGLPMLPFGCDRRGHARFDLKGKVSYNGQSVPAGYIVFTPEPREIPAPAHRRTSATASMPRTPGWARSAVRTSCSIFAFDGKSYTPPGSKMPLVMGHPLFPPYTVKVDLPKKATVFDFAVPKN